MHDKKYSRYKQKKILAQKLSISFHPDDNDKLTYEDAYRIAEEFAREFFWSKGYEVLFAVHTDTEHVREADKRKYIKIVSSSNSSARAHSQNASSMLSTAT